MRNTTIPPRILGALLLLLPLVGTGEIRVELVEVDPVPEASNPRTGSTPIPLSQRFANTGKGRHFVRISPERSFNHADQVLLYTDPALLAQTNAAHTNVVVDLQRRRAYLLVGQQMALETEVAVHQFSQTTPEGFFQMGARIKNGPISESSSTRTPYWMQLGETEVGIHGGHLFGYTAAGSCVRVPIPAAEILFEKTQNGTPVAIYQTWDRSADSPDSDSELSSMPLALTPTVGLPEGAVSHSSSPPRAEVMPARPELPDDHLDFRRSDYPLSDPVTQQEYVPFTTLRPVSAAPPRTMPESPTQPPSVASSASATVNTEEPVRTRNLFGPDRRSSVSGSRDSLRPVSGSTSSPRSLGVTGSEPAPKPVSRVPRWASGSGERPEKAVPKTTDKHQKRLQVAQERARKAESKQAPASAGSPSSSSPPPQSARFRNLFGGKQAN